jgi:hypothetical protein
MATEQEELRLTVTLADNASAGLAKLNEEIKQLGSGASQQHVEKFKRETAELTSKIKSMTGEVGEAFKGLGMLRGGLAAGAAGLALFGFELMRQTKTLVEYADKIRALNQQARQIGVNPAQLKDTIEQLQAFGVSGETAVASIGAVSAKIADLQRQGSQLRLELLKNAGPDRESVRNMEQYLDRLTHAATVAEQLNIIRQGGEQVYNNARRQGYSEQEAANRRNNFWQLQGYNAQLASAGKLQELSKEEQRLADQRQKNAEALSNEMGQVTKKWETLVETMKQPFVLPLLSGLKLVEGALDSITSKVNELLEKEPLRPDKAKENIQEKLGKFGLGGGGGTSFEDRWKERVPEELQKNTEATKQLTDLLRTGGYQPTSFQGGGGGGAVIPAAFHPGGDGGFGGFGGGGGGVSPRSFGGGGYANLEAGGGGAAPYGSGVGAGSGAGAGATPAGPPIGGGRRRGGGGGGGGGGEAAVTPGSSGDTNLTGNAFLASQRAAKIAEINANPQLKRDVLKMLQTEEGNVPGRTATMEALLNRTTMTGTSVEKELHSGFYGPINRGALRGGLSARDAAISEKAFTAAAGGSNLIEGRTDQGTYGDPNAAGPGRIGFPGMNKRSIFNYWKGTRGGHYFSAEESRRFAEAQQAQVAKSGQTSPPIAQTPAEHGFRFGDQGSDPFARRSELPGYMQNAPLDRQQLDRTQAASTKVEGTGKISVDVNAPKGTNVGAEGGGLFKNVEINRQTQMEPARRGPAPPSEVLSI